MFHSKRTVLTVLVVSAFVQIVSGCSPSETTLKPQGITHGVVPLRVDPLCIDPIVPQCSLNTSWDTIDRLTKRVWPTRGAPFGNVAHVLRVFEDGCHPPSDDFPSLTEMRSVMTSRATNAKWYGTQHSLVQTREGLRYVASTGAERSSLSHEDQGAAVLAELGVRLDTPLQTVLGDIETRAVVEDAVANFHPHGEIEWTAIVLMSYIPPRRSWTNKAGHTYDFDDLAKELLSRPLEKAPCNGAHIVYALARLMRTDLQTPILSDDTRQWTSTFLHKTASIVAGTQLDTGAFPVRWPSKIYAHEWYWRMVEATDTQSHADAIGQKREWFLGHDVPDASVSSSPDTVDSVSVTGHHLEWFFLLPVEMQPQKTTYERAAAFLRDALHSASTKDLRRHHCAFSHAARSLRILGRAARLVNSNVDTAHTHGSCSHRRVVFDRLTRSSCDDVASHDDT